MSSAKARSIAVWILRGLGCRTGVLYVGVWGSRGGAGLAGAVWLPNDVGCGVCLTQVFVIAVGRRARGVVCLVDDCFGDGDVEGGNSLAGYRRRRFVLDDGYFIRLGILRSLVISLRARDFPVRGLVINFLDSGFRYGRGGPCAVPGGRLCIRIVLIRI